MYYFFHLFPFVSLIITEVCSLSTPSLSRCANYSILCKKLACPLYLPYLAEAYNRQDTPTHQCSVARLPLIGLTVTQANFEHSGLSPVCLYQLHFIILYISTLSTPNFRIKQNSCKSLYSKGLRHARRGGVVLSRYVVRV